MKLANQETKYLNLIGFLLGLIGLSSQCLIKGCLKCTIGVDTYLETCISCDYGYQLNTSTGLCKYTLCQSYEFMQEYLDDKNQLQKRCVLFCNEDEFSNADTGICQSSYQCTNTYGQPTLTNQSKNIKFVMKGQDGNTFYIVYDTFMNMIDISSGSLIKTIAFDSGLITLQNIDSNLYLISSTSKYLLLWNYLNTQYIQMSILKSGTIKTNSKIIVVEDEDKNQYLVVTSFSDSSSFVYFTEIVYTKAISTPFVSLNLASSLTSIFIFKNIIIQQQSSDYKIKIMSIQYVSSLTLLGESNTYMCNNISGVVIDALQIIIGSIQVKYLIFQATQRIYLVSSFNETNYDCSFLDSESFPIKLLQQDFINLNQRVVFVLISLQNNQIIGFNTQYSLTIPVFKIKVDYAIQDFTSISDLNQVSVYIFLSNNTLQRYKITFTENLTTANIQLQDSINAFISNPKSLSSIQAKDYQKENQFVFLISQEVQIINYNEQSTYSVIKDFKDKVFQNEGQIQKLIYMEQYQFIVSCGLDGKIIVWKSIDPLLPDYFYSLIKSGQQCQDIFEFQGKFVVSLFTNEILIFNVFNYLIAFSYPINSLYYSQIFTTQDYIYLFYNKSAFVLSQPNLIIFSSLYENNPDQFSNVKKLFITKYDQIIIQKLDFSLYLYAFDTSLQQIPQSYLATYNHSYPVYYIALFNQLNQGGKKLLSFFLLPDINFTQINYL